MFTTGSRPRAARSHLASRSASGSRGFTLVEIVVVVIIISVALTMTAVSLSSATGGVAVRESAGGLVSALRYARYYAAIHGRECRVTFSRADGAYDLSCRKYPDGDEFEPLPGGAHNKLASRVRFTTILIRPRDVKQGNGDVISFQPTGECDAASIELSDGRLAYSLSVAPSSGLVRLHKGPAKEVLDDREDLDA